MNAALTHLTQFASWVGSVSLQACVLIVLILSVQKLLGDRLAPRWRHALWLLLLVRLALPWTPESRISAYNVIDLAPRAARWVSFHAQPATPPPAVTTPRAPAAAHADPVVPPAVASRVAADPPVVVRAATQAPVQPVAQPAPARAETHYQLLLSLLWFVGALVVAALAVGQSFSMWAAVRRERFLTDEHTLALLEDCKEEMGIHTYLAVVETCHVTSPALFGIVRPRLLLPAGTLTALDHDQLRHVFLHELSHLRRHDIALNWLMTALQALHWFNPLVWCAFSRVRADREVACDALALSYACPDDPQQYGRTFLYLLERYSQPHRQLPGLAGVLENRYDMQRRMKMIARFRKTPALRPIMAAMLLIALGAVSLTGAPTDPVKTEKAEIMGRVDDFFMHNFRDVTARKSLEWGDVETTGTDGSHMIRYMYEAKIWDKDTKIMNQVFTFDREGRFVEYKNVDGYPKDKEQKLTNPTTTDGMKELVEDFFGNNFRDVTARENAQWGDVTRTDDGNYSISYKCTATINGKDKKEVGWIFTFDPKGKFVGVKDIGDKPAAAADGKYTPEQVKSLDVAYFFKYLGKTPEPGYHGFAAMWALIDKGKAGDKAVVDDILKRSAELLDDTTTEATRWHACYVISNIQDPQAIPILVRVLGKDPNQITRSVAACALGEFSQPEARKALEEAAGTESGPDVKETIQKALSGQFLKSKTPQSKPVVAIEKFELLPYPEGGLFQLCVTIRNDGTAATPNFPVVFYKGNPDTDGKKVSNGDYNSPPIESGKTMGEVTSPFAVKDGPNEFTVVLDPEHKVLPAGDKSLRATVTVSVKDGKLVAGAQDAPSTNKVSSTERPSFIPATSVIEPDGRIVDKIDLPFVNDPAVLGTWKSVDLVTEPDQFKPGQRHWKDDLFLKGLSFLPDGKTGVPWYYWTKGTVCHPGDKTASAYTLKDIDGTTYMFFEWKSGDYVLRHAKPIYYVLKKLAYVPQTSVLDENGRISDKVFLPFVNDPAVIGTWNCVDVVDEVDQFKPGQKQWQGALFLKDLVFQPDGRLGQLGQAWTKGTVVDVNDKTASAYTLKDIDGATYMFYEWKGGDYTQGQRKPPYCVLKKQ